MKERKKIACVIPARLHSLRFPKKVLAGLRGKPLLRWSFEAALNCGCFDKVVIAVDAEETFAAASSFTKEVYYTSSKCQSGTERLVEIQQKNIIDADIWVNWQADEPFLSKTMIKDLLQDLQHPSAEVWTLKTKITRERDRLDPNVVKVVSDFHGKALYFSRHSIPFQKTEGCFPLYKHIGIYAYSNEGLKKISRLPPAELELCENLEQLRFLYHGLHILVHETKEESFGIDTKDDLADAEMYLSQKFGKYLS
ncbi:MAG: 3-deoxy-manno-octulosonate cytidylyltransferase [Simkaniaceae bacterium]